MMRIIAHIIGATVAIAMTMVGIRHTVTLATVTAAYTIMTGIVAFFDNATRERRRAPYVEDMYAMVYMPMAGLCAAWAVTVVLFITGLAHDLYAVLYGMASAAFLYAAITKLK